MLVWQLLCMNVWFLCLAGLLYYIYSRRKLYWLSWQLPGPNPALPLIGNLLVLINLRSITDVISYLDQMLSKYSKKCGMVRYWISTKLVIMINEPSVAYQLNQKTQLKSEEYQYLGKPFLRTGLLITNDMPFHKRAKKAYHLGLSPEKLKGMIPRIHEESLRAVDQLREYSIKNQSVFTEKIFQFLAMSSAVHGTFDFDVHTKDEEENRVFLRSYESLFEYFQLRLVIPPLRNDFIHTLMGTRAKELKHANTSLAYIQSILDAHEAKKLEDKHGFNTKAYNERSFLDHILGEEFNMSTEEVMGNMLMMMLTGTGAVATSCTMLLILLAQNPEIQNKLYDEIVQVLGDDMNKCPSMEEISNITYLNGAVKETLRMFPAAPYIGKTVDEDTTLTGSDGKEYLIPEGTTVGIFIRNIHNNPDIYENPSKFDPDRWLPENVARRPPNSYLPFSSGGRKCVGPQLAVLVMRTVAVTVLRAFEIVTSRTCEKFEDIHVEMKMTMKIRDKCQIMLRERKRNRSL